MVGWNEVISCPVAARSFPSIDDWVLSSHRARAQAAGRSVEEELRHVLTEAALTARRKAVGE